MITGLRSRPSSIERLVEDLAATLPLFESLQAAGRTILPSPALLGVLGEAYLDGLPRGEFPAEKCPGFDRLVGAWLWPTGLAEVRLSLFLAGVIVARRDVWSGFLAEGPPSIDWPRCLQWLVIHGIRELRLTRFVQAEFVATLRRDSIPFGDAMISPLELMVVREHGASRWTQLLHDRDAVRSMLQDWTATRSDEEMKVLFDGAAQRPIRPDAAPVRTRPIRPSADRFRTRVSSVPRGPGSER